MARAKYIAEGHASGGCCCGRRHGCGQGGCEDDCTNTWGKWGAKSGPATPVTNTSSGDGVEKRNGSWMTNCKLCGWNDTHTSKYCGKWN